MLKVNTLIVISPQNRNTASNNINSQPFAINSIADIVSSQSWEDQTQTAEINFSRRIENIMPLDDFYTNLNDVFDNIINNHPLSVSIENDLYNLENPLIQRGDLI